jgi:hypothetical protein
VRRPFRSSTPAPQGLDAAAPGGFGAGPGRGRDAGGQHQDAGHLRHGQQPVGDVVGVVGRGEPGEVHPRPPDREEDLEERHQPGHGVAVGDVVGQLRGDGRDRDHEGQIEQQFQLARGAVRFVDRTRPHPDPEPVPGAD